MNSIEIKGENLGIGLEEIYNVGDEKLCCELRINLDLTHEEFIKLLKEIAKKDEIYRSKGRESLYSLIDKWKIKIMFDGFDSFLKETNKEK